MFLLKLLYYLALICSQGAMTFKLLFSNGISLMIADFTTSEITLVTDNISRAVSVDYHKRNGYIYWSDVIEHTISRIKYSTTSDETAETIITDDVHTPDGIAVDSINNHLYWTDTGIDKVMRSDLNGSNIVTILDTDLEEPRAIALDLRNNMMYLTDWGRSPKIERCKLDGSDRESIITVDLHWPNGLALDLDGERIYWIDAGQNEIRSANLNGSDVQLLLKSSSWLSRPFAIDIDGGFIYYSDWSLANILRVSKVANSTPIALFNGQFLPMGLKIYKPQIDGSWGSWTAWGLCSGSCGSGIQSRLRACNNPVPENGGRNCTGVKQEHQSCSLKACPVNHE